MLGVSEKTVRSRIARLRSDYGLTVTARIEEPGMRSRMVYLVVAETGQRFALGESLVDRPEVEQVQLATGSADLLVTASFADDSAALRFQLEVLGNDPAVHSVQVCHLLGDVGGQAYEAARTGPAADEVLLASLLVRAFRSADLAELGGIICDAMVDGLAADRANLLVADRPGGGWSSGMVATSRGISAEYLNEINAQIAGGRMYGVVKRVWETRQHVFIPDARTDPLTAPVHDVIAAEGYVGILTIPVLHGESLIATISLYYDRLVALDDQYLATAQGVADHFAVPVARACGFMPAVLPAPGGTTDGLSGSAA